MTNHLSSSSEQLQAIVDQAEAEWTQLLAKMDGVVSEEQFEAVQGLATRHVEAKADLIDHEQGVADTRASLAPWLLSAELTVAARQELQQEAGETDSSAVEHAEQHLLHRTTVNELVDYTISPDEPEKK